MSYSISSELSLLKQYYLQIIILLDSLEIVDYAVGHVGSVHDALAFKDTRIYNEHQTLLPRGDYLLADPAYAVTGWCIAPFKRPAGGTLTREQRRFNYYHSRLRVQVECAIGLLKGTWQSLRELRVQIKDQRCHAWAIIWIRCTIILHNIIIRHERRDCIATQERDRALINEVLGRTDLNLQNQDILDSILEDDENPTVAGEFESPSIADEDGKALHMRLMSEILRSHPL